jgi:hypothetical protein
VELDDLDKIEEEVMVVGDEVLENEDESNEDEDFVMTKQCIHHDEYKHDHEEASVDRGMTKEMKDEKAALEPS